MSTKRNGQQGNRISTTSCCAARRGPSALAARLCKKEFIFTLNPPDPWSNPVPGWQTLPDTNDARWLRHLEHHPRTVTATEAGQPCQCVEAGQRGSTPKQQPLHFCRPRALLWCFGILPFWNEQDNVAMQRHIRVLMPLHASDRAFPSNRGLSSFRPKRCLLMLMMLSPG